MSLNESGIEIEATLTIQEGDIELSADIIPIPALEDFDTIDLMEEYLICSFDSTLHETKREYKYAANNVTLPSLVSCAGQWAEDYVWYFDFDESIYDQVKTLFDEKGITYQLPDETGMILVKVD